MEDNKTNADEEIEEFFDDEYCECDHEEVDVLCCICGKAFVELLPVEDVHRKDEITFFCHECGHAFADKLEKSGLLKVEENADSLDMDENGVDGETVEIKFSYDILELKMSKSPCGDLREPLFAGDTSEKVSALEKINVLISYENAEAKIILIEFIENSDSLTDRILLESLFENSSRLYRLRNEKRMKQAVLGLLRRTESSTKTRRLINAILKFLDSAMDDEIRAELEKELRNPRWTYRMKNKFKEMLT